MNSVIKRQILDKQTASRRLRLRVISSNPLIVNRDRLRVARR
jgi:hypothetical protein